MHERLPPYSYVTGRFPHPIRDPRGHSYGRKPTPVEAVDPAAWRESAEFLYAVDLFNHGYYWEAHEAWEALWHAAGKKGPVADFLKGLIKLAAAGVKVREGRPIGVRRHALRAGELFAQTAVSLAGDKPRLLGLDLNDLSAFARHLAEVPPKAANPAASVEVVFDFVLRPQ